MKAIVDAAHALGHRVAIHSYGPSGVKDAVRAGADSVEHGIDLDDETIADMMKRGTVWVPTIDHNRYYVDAKDEFGFKPEAIPPLQEYIQKNLESTRRAVAAGVRIGMGSDAVYTMFGQNTRELGWLVKAGMTPEEALQSATTVAADLLDMHRQDRPSRPGPVRRHRGRRGQSAGAHRRDVHGRQVGHERGNGGRRPAVKRSRPTTDGPSRTVPSPEPTALACPQSARIRASGSRKCVPIRAPAALRGRPSASRP